jgi:hypothetical protein
MVAVLAGLVAIFVSFDLPRVDANLLLAAGASFQLAHALAILGLAALGWPRDHVAWLFFYGILLFSGSPTCGRWAPGRQCWSRARRALSCCCSAGSPWPGRRSSARARRGPTGADPWRPLTAVKL